MSVDLVRTLTPHQLEILALYASGYQMAEIGQMKFLSPHSVRSTLQRAARRAEAKTLTNLCAMAVQAGLLVPNGDGFVPLVDPYVMGE